MPESISSSGSENDSGTFDGGAGFYFLYAAFLQEAAEITDIDQRKHRMIKRHEAFDPKLLGANAAQAGGRRKGILPR